MKTKRAKKKPTKESRAASREGAKRCRARVTEAGLVSLVIICHPDFEDGLKEIARADYLSRGIIYDKLTK